MAKQTAGQRNFQVALTDKFRYDLAPDFFLIGMLKSSCLLYTSWVVEHLAFGKLPTYHGFVVVGNDLRDDGMVNTFGL